MCYIAQSLSVRANPVEETCIPIENEESHNQVSGEFSGYPGGRELTVV